MKVYVVKVDKDLALFDIEGYRFWGKLRRGKKFYSLVDERGRLIAKVHPIYGEKLLEFIKKKNPLRFKEIEE